MLDIRLLGSPDVTVDGEPIDVDTRKAIAMLAYLAIERSADRDSLAALFWADSPPDRARATLRRTLSALRGGVGADAVAADRNQVELSGSFTLDVDRFLEAIDETTRHDHGDDEACARCVEPLSRALDLYRGDFLGAFSVRDAPDFEDWARPVTESLRLKAGGAFQRLAMALASTGDYQGAIAATGRWIALDELHEPAHRLLMLLNAWAGDRPGSIQAYRDCVAILDQELGVSPLEETTELYEAILDEDLPPAPAVRRAVKAVRSAHPAGPAEILDRTGEIAELQLALEQSLSGSRFCLLSGESWMGKTRLIEHLGDQAPDLGFTVLAARAFRAETKLPYGVAIQLLGPLVDAAGRAGADLPEWALGELSRLDPKLAPGQSTPATERFGVLRLREAFLTLVETVAGVGPLLIAVDDAQWMDTASATLVAYILRRRDVHSVMIALATRHVDLLHPSLRDLAGGADTAIQLQALSPDDLSDDYPDVDLASVIRATGGIPLLVKEALDSGAVEADSRSVTRYMESRRARLSDLSRQVMAAAAVLNGMCDAQLLRDVSGRTDDEIVEAVEELVTAGLMSEDLDGHLGFTLDVLENVTYESTSLIRRRLLHRRSAEALQSRPRSETDVRLATTIADHLRIAGSDQAADWYRLSGDLARGVFANNEAVASYENAIALGHPDVGVLRLALGELAMTRGDYQTATRELRAAASHSSDAGLALVEHRIGDLHRTMGRFELAEESFARAQEHHPERADLYADWALLRHRTGDDPAAGDFALESLAAAESSGDQDQLARALNILGVVTAEPTTALKHIDQALQLVASTDPARIAALNNKAHLLVENGDLEGAIELVTEAIDLADRTGYRHHQAALVNHLADIYHMSGREGDAEAALKEAVTIFADIVTGDWEPEVWLLREW